MAAPSEPQAHIDLLGFPEALRSSGDPSPRNPFSDDDPRHAVWANATRRAEQEKRAFNAASLKLLEDVQPRTQDEALRVTAANQMQIVTGRFDIWAKRTVHIVWSESDEQAFVKWLEHYANESLNHLRPLLPAELGNTDWVLDDLRNRLIARIEYWKSEARRYLNEQAEDRNARALINRGGSLKGDEIVSAPPPTIATSQQAWNLMRDDVTLRHHRMAGRFNEQLQKDLLALDFEARQKNNAGYYLPARVKLEIRDTNERAQGLYEACCEVWEIQGFTKNRVFYRAVFEYCLEPLFAMRRGCISWELTQRDTRTGNPGNSSAAQGSLAQEMNHLRSDWNTKLEIETRDSETRERAARAREAQQLGSRDNEYREPITRPPQITLKNRPTRTKPPCYEAAASIVQGNPHITSLAFCKAIDDKAARNPKSLKFLPPVGWRVQTFFDMYKRRKNTVDAFLSRVRKQISTPTPG